MRKFILVFTICIIVLGSSALWANTSLLLKGGMELAGNTVFYEGGDNPNTGVDPSFTIGAEIFGQVSEYYEIGAGIMLQLNRTFADGSEYDKDDSDEVEKPNFRYIPIYGLIRLSQKGTAIYRFGAIGQLGYSPLVGNDEFIHNRNINGGLYLGLGGFLHFNKKIYAEVMYRVCGASIVLRDAVLDIKTSSIGIMLGYRLPM